MKLKSEAHEALSVHVQQDNVLPTILCDNPKEMVLGQFNRKIKEASCHLKQTESFTPWLNAAKREMKELRKVQAGSSLNLAP